MWRKNCKTSRFIETIALPNGADYCSAVEYVLKLLTKRLNIPVMLYSL